MKKLLIVSAIIIVTTGSSTAFGAMTETSDTARNQEITKQSPTAPTPKIVYPVQVVDVLSGPIKTSELLAGPIVKTETPVMGSIEWLAQEKERQDKLESDAERKQAELEAEIARLEKIAADTKKLNETLVLVKKEIGKSWWVFSGSTPGAWDCSGLVRWTYAHLGVDLEHRASVQRDSGKIVTEPKIGDLVSFNYRNSARASHIGIYTGPDEMIHAGGKPGDRTELHSISKWAKDNAGSEIVYTRIIETNN